jgi:quaternary ammonium compound-resistance protein SugE
MNWIFLIFAGLCEVAFTFCLGHAKNCDGTKHRLWIAAFVILYALSAVLLSKATQAIPVGIAYPIWTGIGAVGAVLVGLLVFNEPITFWQIFFVVTLVVSIVGLKILE